MNERSMIQIGDELRLVLRRNEDGTNDGSIVVERRAGQVYCIAKAPRYATDEEWKYNAELLINALRTSNPTGQVQP